MTPMNRGSPVFFSLPHNWLHIIIGVLGRIAYTVQLAELLNKPMNQLTLQHWYPK